MSCTCKDFVGFLADYLEDSLSAEQRRVFDAHLEACPACVTYLKTYQETIQLGQAVCKDPEGAAPEDAPEELIQAILQTRKG